MFIRPDSGFGSGFGHRFACLDQKQGGACTFPFPIEPMLL